MPMLAQFLNTLTIATVVSPRRGYLQLFGELFVVFLVRLLKRLSFVSPGNILNTD